MEIRVIHERVFKENWTIELIGLEKFFSSVTLLTGPIMLSPGTTITDSNSFYHSHLGIVKANNGNKTFLPYLERLQELKQYLTANLK